MVKTVAEHFHEVLSTALSFLVRNLLNLVTQQIGYSSGDVVLSLHLLLLSENLHIPQVSVLFLEGKLNKAQRPKCIKACIQI